nr:hypothetical protein [Actinomycetota bacterium]
AAGVPGARRPWTPSRIGLAAAAVLVGGVAWLASGSSSGPSGPGNLAGGGSSNLTALAPDQALQAVVAAAHAAGSCHVVGTSSVLGQEITVNGDSSPSAADVSQVRGAEQYRTVVTGGRTFVRGNAAALTAELGLTSAQASAYAGRWISLQPGDRPTAVLDAAVLGQCAATAQTSSTGPVNPLTLFGFGSTGGVQAPVVQVAGPDAVGGQRTMTISVTGKAPATAAAGVTVPSTSPLQVAATLVVLAASPNLPVAEHVAFTGSDTGFSVHVDVTVAFAAWGEAVAPATPAGAVPFASLSPAGS